MSFHRLLRLGLLVSLSLSFTFSILAIPAAASPVDEPTPQVIDDFETPLVSGQDADGISIGFFAAQDGNSTTTFARTDSPPATIPDFPTPNNVLQMDFTVSSFGVVIHNFVNDDIDTWTPQDWSTYEGFGFWLYGNNSGTDLFIDIIDNRGPNSTTDDAERFSVTFEDDFTGWRYLQFPFEDFVRKEIGNGAPNDGFTLTAVHGWAFGSLTTDGTQTFYIDQVNLYGQAEPRPLAVSFTTDAFTVEEGTTATISAQLNQTNEEAVTVAYATADGSATNQRDYTSTSGTLTFPPGVTQQTFTITTLDDAKFEGNETILLWLTEPEGAELGFIQKARLAIAENDAFDSNLIDDFEIAPDQFDTTPGTRLFTREIPNQTPLAQADQGDYEQILIATSRGGGDFGRHFALGQDWSGAQGLSFWAYGRNTGAEIGVQLLDNRATVPQIPEWELVWSDEFNESAGTPPNPAIWTPEIGDGTIRSIPGWGNSELQYYTDSPDNVAMDGNGNLVITVRETDENSNLLCYYGPCEYTSARLITENKVEFAYGRIEMGVELPRGAGLWPAFWSLGTNIDQVGWPQSGEIDFMEFVGREPNQVFGTIHGPGYSGGASFGDTYDFDEEVPSRYRTFTVEWEPNRIVWYVDGIKYHEATPEDVAPNEWVFNQPFYLLMNVAVGGNFGGPVGEETTFPQTMAVDYVRVYQGPDTAERFEATFVDVFSGWQQITIPFDTFSRSMEQPDSAPDDGLTLTDIWGYRFELPASYRGGLALDQVQLDLP
ncbi:MAG: carbohydrate binding domain-containing protein [Chloroflexota bacterium]